MIFRAVYIHRIHNGGRSRKDWCPNHQLEAGQYYSFSFAGFRLSKAALEFVVVFAFLQLCLRTLMALEPRPDVFGTSLLSAVRLYGYGVSFGVVTFTVRDLFCTESSFLRVTRYVVPYYINVTVFLLC